MGYAIVWSLLVALAATPAFATSVSSLTLVNAATDRDIGPLRNGATVDLSKTGTSLNIRANTSGTVGSVYFSLNSGQVTRLENYLPYALYADDKGNYNSGNLRSGATYTLSVTPYSRANRQGTRGATMTVRFYVVSGNVVPAPPLPSPTPKPSATPVATPPPSSSDGIPVSGLRRVFRSSFETPVALRHSSSGSSSKLTGADAGFSWDNLDHLFNYVASNALGSGLVRTEITTARARSGSRSLYMDTMPDSYDGAQNRLQYHGDDNVHGEEQFTRRFYYFPDLAAAFSNGDYLSIGGLREYGPPTAGSLNDFSLPLHIVRNSSTGRLMWRQYCIDYSQGSGFSAWVGAPNGCMHSNTTVPVPLNRWFRLDIYVKRSTTNGVLKVWVDGVPVFDLNGIKTKKSGSRWFNKLADIDGNKKVNIYVDDVEIWQK